MTKLSRLLSLFSAGVFALVAGHAQALPFVFTTYGTISSGNDFSGVFGSPFASLAGQSYRQSISFDPARNANNFGSQHFSTSQGSAAAVLTTEVNGHVFTSEVGGGMSYASISNFLTQLGPVFPGFQWRDNVFVSACGTAADMQFTCDLQQVSSLINPFVQSSMLAQHFSYNTQAGDFSEVRFFTSGTRGFALFDGTVSGMAWNVIPEPATLAMVGAGLLLVGGLGRRKKA